MSPSIKDLRKIFVDLGPKCWGLELECQESKPDLHGREVERRSKRHKGLGQASMDLSMGAEGSGPDPGLVIKISSSVSTDKGLALMDWCPSIRDWVMASMDSAPVLMTRLVN